MSKKAIILHAMGQTSKGHWYPWLKAILEQRGYKVWVPDMPTPDMPNARRTTEFLLSNRSWDFNENLIIGHSWGAVQVLHLLQNLPSSVVCESAVLVSPFDRPAKGMEEQHAGLFAEPYDFDLIKTKAKGFLFIHGSNDPWVPVQGSKNLAEKLGGDLEIIEDGQHFSTSLDPSYKEFPKLVEILEQKKLLK